MVEIETADRSLSCLFILSKNSFKELSLSFIHQFNSLIIIHL